MKKARLAMLSGNNTDINRSQQLLSTDHSAQGGALTHTVLIVVHSIPALQTENQGAVRLRNFCRMTLLVRGGTWILTQSHSRTCPLPLSTVCGSRWQSQRDGLGNPAFPSLVADLNSRGQMKQGSTYCNERPGSSPRDYVSVGVRTPFWKTL